MILIHQVASQIVANVYASLLMLSGSRRAFAWVKPTALQFLLMMVLATAANALFGYLASGQDSFFNVQGIINYLVWPFMGLILGMIIAGRTNVYSFMLVPAVLWLSSDTLVALAQSTLQLLFNHGGLPIWAYRFVPIVFLVLFIWQSVSLLWILAKKFRWSLPEQALVLVAAIVLLTLWQSTVQNQPIWRAKLSQPVIDESVIYNQQALLNSQTHGLTRSADKLHNWFFLGVAGSAYQDVFYREVNQVKHYFDSSLGTRLTSLSLVNNLSTRSTLPVASTISIQSALDELGSTMSPDDVLFLLISSHGLPDEIELNNDPLVLTNLSSKALKKYLDDAGIPWRVIVISSCYSGSFIDELKSPKTLIITSSAANKQSFGCTNQADFTYFGEAFFVKSLPKTHSMLPAFEKSKQHVATQEQAQGFNPSEPQLFVGEEIKVMLPQLEQSLFPNK